MSLRKYQMTKPEELPEFRDPEIHEPGETYLSTKIMDRCINCETTQKIIGKISIGRKSGSICVKCFKAYQK